MYACGMWVCNVNYFHILGVCTLFCSQLNKWTHWKGSSLKTTWCQEERKSASPGLSDNLTVNHGRWSPKPLSFEGNVALNWKHFTQEVEIFIAAAYGEKDDRTKAYIFLN